MKWRQDSTRRACAQARDARAADAPRTVDGAALVHPAFLDQVSGRSGAGEDLKMPKVLDNVITAAVADPNTHTVTLAWANGETTANGFGHLIGKGMFAALTDPAFFARVHVGERGRSLEWPDEIDFCADALWFEAHPAEAPQQPKRVGDQPA
jgi:hypothetical protein